MHLFLIPISTRRTLIYCQRLNVITTNDVSLLDKLTGKANNIWLGWEKKDSGWQKKVVDFGNKALKRIPYEEWGLKSIPPLSKRRKEEELGGKRKIEVSFPSTIIPQDKITDVLRTLGTERQQLHKSRLLWSIAGMPIAAPFGLIPIIPNLPFFYLTFRAYSHWKALKGSQHIEFLLNEKLIIKKPSKILDELYSRRKFPVTKSTTPSSPTSPPKEPALETMLLQTSDGKRIATTLNIPELEVELDRAVWQVEKDIKAQKELQDEKDRLASVNKQSKND